VIAPESYITTYKIRYYYKVTSSAVRAFYRKISLASSRALHCFTARRTSCRERAASATVYTPHAACASSPVCASRVMFISRTRRLHGHHVACSSARSKKWQLITEKEGERGASSMVRWLRRAAHETAPLLRGIREMLSWRVYMPASVSML